ncbi:MAG: MGMT family protein [Verrucomicrobiae bacterium]|nr:MGMT family protein [Verrucomicrobiae bacterium]MCB1086227.1 MGMT family protein [Verrucomicrobiae bacterium]MCB1090970.1 MGMT family protein [Verrucomicrobiae bacterium]
MTPIERPPTLFERRVYDALCRVPKGKVTTYGRLGRELGCGSAQAIGQALRRNPYAPEVPCHRVVAGDLRIGGFAGDREGAEIERKIRMLREEGVEFDADGRVAEDCLYDFRSE